MPTVRFKIARAQDYRLIHASGAFGGGTAEQLFRMELYSQAETPPDFVELEVAEDKTRSARREPAAMMLREIQVGVVMTLESAERLGQWLLNQTKAVKERRAKAEAEKKT